MVCNKCLYWANKRDHNRLGQATGNNKMSLAMTRHQLLMPTQPSKKSLPVAVPVRKTATPLSSARRTQRDRSPEMLFDMSPSENGDAPIHYHTLTAPSGSSPAPSAHSTHSHHSHAQYPHYGAQPFPISKKNRLSLVDASLAPIMTAPVPLNAHHQKPEPFLYAFPTLSPAYSAAPQSLPTRGRPVALRATTAPTHTHTPSPPFGPRGASLAAAMSSRATEPATPPLTGAFRGSLASSVDGSVDEDDDGDLPPDAFFGGGTECWRPQPDSGFGASVKQHELDRGRQRAPKHRRY